MQYDIVIEQAERLIAELKERRQTFIEFSEQHAINSNCPGWFAYLPSEIVNKIIDFLLPFQKSIGLLLTCRSLFEMARSKYDKVFEIVMMHHGWPIDDLIYRITHWISKYGRCTDYPWYNLAREMKEVAKRSENSHYEEISGDINMRDMTITYAMREGSIVRFELSDDIYKSKTVVMDDLRVCVVFGDSYHYTSSSRTKKGKPMNFYKGSYITVNAAFRVESYYVLKEIVDDAHARYGISTPDCIIKLPTRALSNPKIRKFLLKLMRDKLPGCSKWENLKEHVNIEDMKSLLDIDHTTTYNAELIAKMCEKLKNRIGCSINE